MKRVQVIERLKTFNFQKHEELELEFDPHITTIIGSSDIGKSSIIRNLIWILTNKPNGIAFIKDGTNKTKSLLTIDSKKIIRTRSKSTNTYHIGSTKKEPLEAFGSDVPEVLKSFFNVSTINFQTQYDSPFWFSETAGEVSRQLNNIVSLDIMDKTMANIVKQLNSTQTEIRIHEKKLEELTEELKRLEPIRNMIDDFANVKELERRYQKYSRKHATINELVKRCIIIQKQRENAAELVLDVKNVTIKGKLYVESTDKTKKLQELVDKARELTKQTTRTLPVIDELEEAKNKYEISQNKYEKLELLISKAARAERLLKQTKIEADGLNKELENMLGDTCPLCGAEL